MYNAFDTECCDAIIANSARLTAVVDGVLRNGRNILDLADNWGETDELNASSRAPPPPVDGAPGYSKASGAALPPPLANATLRQDYHSGGGGGRVRWLRERREWKA